MPTGLWRLPIWANSSPALEPMSVQPRSTVWPDLGGIGSRPQRMPSTRRSMRLLTSEISVEANMRPTTVTTKPTKANPAASAVI